MPRNFNLGYACWATSYATGATGRSHAFFLEQAVALNSQDYTAHFQLGALEMSIGSFAAAAENFDRALAIDPSRTDAYLNLGTSRQEVADSRWRAASLSKRAVTRPLAFLYRGQETGISFQRHIVATRLGAQTSAPR